MNLPSYIIAPFIPDTWLIKCTFQEFEPKASTVSPGTADLCFITADPVIQVRMRLENAGVELVSLGDENHDQGTVPRTGARGALRSVYCRDPDGNLIE